MVRQRIIEWILCLQVSPSSNSKDFFLSLLYHNRFNLLLFSIQDFYKNTEETLEMTIRIFDYIYFNDLLSNQETNGGLDEKYFQFHTHEMDLIYENFSSQSDYLDSIPRAVNEKCLCGSLHNGWLKLDQLQLVALACYHLACKFWERFPPRVRLRTQIDLSINAIIEIESIWFLLSFRI